ncbi:MAG TPA: hypothetical protein VIN59_08795 [Alphaproteobacteria bacterium]
MAALSIQTILDDVRAGAMDDQRMIDLFMGRDEQDRPYWAYVAIIPSKYQEYRETLERGDALELDQFGLVLSQGHTQMPPKDIQNKMSMNGFLHHLEDDVITAVYKANI